MSRVGCLETPFACTWRLQTLRQSLIGYWKLFSLIFITSAVFSMKRRRRQSLSLSKWNWFYRGHIASSSRWTFALEEFEKHYWRACSAFVAFQRTRETRNSSTTSLSNIHDWHEIEKVLHKSVKKVWTERSREMEIYVFCCNDLFPLIAQPISESFFKRLNAETNVRSTQLNRLKKKKKTSMHQIECHQAKTMIDHHVSCSNMFVQCQNFQHK